MLKLKLLKKNTIKNSNQVKQYSKKTKAKKNKKKNSKAYSPLSNYSFIKRKYPCLSIVTFSTEDIGKNIKNLSSSLTHRPDKVSIGMTIICSDSF